MPITPQQYTQKIHDNLQAVVAAIDRLLDEAAADGHPLPQDLAIPALAHLAKVSSNHVYALKDDVINTYSALGWNVTFTSDQRDGDYFQFSA